jgi:hypothetical protein
MASTNATGTRFLVIVMLGNTSVERLRTFVPALQRVLNATSTEAPTQEAFRSATADVFGYFIRSKLNASQVRARIDSPDPPPFLDNNDRILVLEIGDSFSAFGNSNAWRWLQHH